MIDKDIKMPGINEDLKKFHLDLDKLEVRDSTFTTASRTLINRAIKLARRLPATPWWVFWNKDFRDFKTRTWRQKEINNGIKSVVHGIRVWRTI